jgi:outer membrane protein assembly factor BamB
MNLVWVTDAGYLYSSRANRPGVRSRLSTYGEFSAPPAYHAPLVYAVSLAGELFAVDEELGIVRWRYMTGFPTNRAPAVVGDRLYVTSDEPVLHAIDAKTGIGQWEARGISQFAAVTDKHVYGMDRFGTLHVLDQATGRAINRIPTGGAISAFVNDQTDRLYLISETGLIQCLYEIGADKPTYYVEQSASAPPETAEEPAAEYRGDGEPGAAPPQPVAPADEAEASADGLPAFDADNPFGPPAATPIPPQSEPADAAPFDDDPFAG